MPLKSHWWKRYFVSKRVKDTGDIGSLWVEDTGEIDTFRVKDTGEVCYWNVTLWGKDIGEICYWQQWNRYFVSKRHWWSRYFVRKDTCELKTMMK